MNRSRIRSKIKRWLHDHHLVYSPSLACYDEVKQWVGRSDEVFGKLGISADKAASDIHHFQAMANELYQRQIEAMVNSYHDKEKEGEPDDQGNGEIHRG